MRLGRDLFYAWLTATLFSGAPSTLYAELTNGDPLELTTDVMYLFIRGQRTSMDNRHLRLYEKYSLRPKAQ